MNMLRSIKDLFFAGTETSSTTLQWALLYLINYPKVQNTCRHEILEVREFTKKQIILYVDSSLNLRE